MSDSPHIRQLGNQALLLSWEAKIDSTLHQHVLQWKAYIEQNFKNQIIECVATYQELAVYLSPKASIKEVYRKLNSIEDFEGHIAHVNTYCYTIPVCYDVVFGLDLDAVATHHNLSKTDVITLHTQATYTVYFTGFLPGFPYLGGLSERLHTPRKQSPRLKVPKGAVGIGGKQTGIYPSTSPGGWQIIGKTPISLFDSTHSAPSLLKAGDQIQFSAISYDTFISLKNKIHRGNYHIERKELVDD